MFEQWFCARKVDASAFGVKSYMWDITTKQLCSRAIRALPDVAFSNDGRTHTVHVMKVVRVGASCKHPIAESVREVRYYT